MITGGGAVDTMASQIASACCRLQRGERRDLSVTAIFLSPTSPLSLSVPILISSSLCSSVSLVSLYLSLSLCLSFSFSLSVSPSLDLSSLSVLSVSLWPLCLSLFLGVSVSLSSLHLSLIFLLPSLLSLCISLALSTSLCVCLCHSTLGNAPSVCFFHLFAAVSFPRLSILFILPWSLSLSLYCLHLCVCASHGSCPHMVSPGWLALFAALVKATPVTHLWVSQGDCVSLFPSSALSLPGC